MFKAIARFFKWLINLFKKQTKQTVSKQAEVVVERPYRYRFVRYTSGGNHTILFDNKFKREVRKNGRWVVNQ